MYTLCSLFPQPGTFPQDFTFFRSLHYHPFLRVPFVTTPALYWAWSHSLWLTVSPKAQHRIWHKADTQQLLNDWMKYSIPPHVLSWEPHPHQPTRGIQREPLIALVWRLMPDNRQSHWFWGAEALGAMVAQKRQGVRRSSWRRRYAGLRQERRGEESILAEMWVYLIWIGFY